MNGKDEIVTEADSITPLDTDVEAVETTVEVARVSPEDYKTRGRTTVATRPGYAFDSGRNLDIPTITHEGLLVNADQAADLVDESDGVVFVLDDNTEED